MKAPSQLLLLLALTASAHAAPLTRPDAQRAIEKYADFATVTTIPNAIDPAFDRGVKDGIWVNTRSGWQPTALGRQYFTSVSMLGMKLATPLHRSVVAITGMSAGAVTSDKIVEFTWRFTDLTRSLSDYTGATTGDHAGTAVFHRYDDGWRIVNLNGGSVRGGANSRPFKEEKSTAGFRFLGTFQPDKEYALSLVRLWHYDPKQVVGIVERPIIGAESAKGKIKGGNFDPVTGALNFLTIMDGTILEFQGSLKADAIKGVITRRDLQTGTLFMTEKVSCRKLPEDESDRRRFMSREQWEEQYVKGLRLRPEQ
jgi:hypothetical protein